MKYKENVCKTELRSFTTMKNTKIRRKIPILWFYESFLIWTFYRNTGKISVIQKYEKEKFYNIDARVQKHDQGSQNA